MSRRILAFAPLFVVLSAILVLYLTGVAHKISFQTIQDKHVEWKNYVDLHPTLSALYFIGIYVLSVLLVIPDSTFLTLLGGFLFPLPLAVLYTCFAETLGATLFFLATWLASKALIDPKRIRFLAETQKRIEVNQVYYLLFFRLSHLLPFWIINLTAGIIHVRVGTFIWTTLVGILPLTYFIALGGKSLSHYFDTHARFSIVEFFTPELKIVLIALGCISLVPLFFRKLRK